MKACDNCGSTDTQHLDESHSLHLYRHRDDFQQCQDCGHVEAYRGKALDDAEAGMAFYVIQGGTELVAWRPTCPVHDAPMYPTKFWPDDATVQFKCPVEQDGEPCQRLDSQELTEVQDG